MILKSDNNVTSNIQGAVEFSVSDNSAKIFSFLSNFLYKDKERSVMTELCSNAIDAHKDAGKSDTPIKVSIPTALDQAFKVRDYGKGLSEAHVYQFLTKYGESSKGESNDFIGGFGIGSKSPAAVSDSWTITSHYEGEESSYLIHINSSGIPSIINLYKKPTTESGLEVSIPVTGAINYWKDAAFRVFEHYDVLPNINLGIVKKDMRAVINGAVLFPTSGPRYSTSHSVLMNKREYALDIKKLRENIPFAKASCLCFDTSTLSVSLSREDLQYDKKTIEAINDKLKFINSFLSDDWFKSVSQSTDLVAYQRTASDFKIKYNVTKEACVILAAHHKDALAKGVNFENLEIFNIVLDANPQISVHFRDRISSIHTPRNYRSRPASLPYVTCKSDYISYGQNIKRVPDEISLVFTSKTPNDIVFILKDVRDVNVVVKYAIAENKLISNVVILDEKSFNLIPNIFTKITASSLGKPIRIKKEKATKVESDKYYLDGRTFKSFNFVESASLPTIYIRFAKANSRDSIINPFDKLFVRDLLHQNNTEFVCVFIKNSTINVPSHWKTPVQHVADTLQTVGKIPNLKDDFIIGKMLRTRGYHYDSVLSYLFSNLDMLSPVSMKYAPITGLIERIKVVKSYSATELLTINNNYAIMNTYGSFMHGLDPVNNIKPIDDINSLSFNKTLVDALPLMLYMNFSSMPIDVCNAYIETAVNQK